MYNILTTIIYHLLHFLSTIQHPGVMKELGWKRRATPGTAPLPQVAWPSQLCPSAQPGNEPEYVMEGKEKIKAMLRLCSLDAPCSPYFYLQWAHGRVDNIRAQGQCVRKKTWHFHISHFLLFFPSAFLAPAFLTFCCRYCLLSRLHRQQ